MSKEDVLTKFYNHVSRTESLKGLDIPTSKVFFVRRAIADATGISYTLQHIEIALFLEGHLDPDKYFLDGLPEWYVVQYQHSFDRDKLREVYRQRILDSAEHEVLSLEGQVLPQ